MMNIVISPSQQDWNKCAFGDTEKDHTWDIAKKIADLLRLYDCNVCLIPKIDGDENFTLNQVVNISNSFIRNFGGAGYHLDIHTDAGGGKGCSGFYMSEPGKGFITQIWRQVCKITPWGDGRVDYREFKVLRDTIAVAGLIELSFHDDAEQAKWIHVNIDALAMFCVKGIVDVTGIELLHKQNEFEKHAKNKHWAEDSYQSLLAAGYKINDRRFDEPLKRGEFFAIEAQKISK